MPQLPYDILTYIFKQLGPKTYMPNDFEHVVGGDEQTLPPVHSFAFSQVCRHWRQAALAIPTLWTVPLLHSVPLANLMIERAAKTPLTIIWPSIGERADDRLGLDHEKRSYETLLHILEDHVQQVSVLDLQACERSYWDPDTICEYVLAQSMMLNKLRIGFKIDSDDPWPVVKTMDYRESVLSPGITAITHLSLVDCFVQLPTVVVGHLTALTLILTSTHLRMPAEEVLDLLNGAPCLTSLHLWKVFGYYSDARLSRSQIVEFPNLRSLYLSDYYTAIADFLALVNTPSVEVLNIDTSSWNYGSSIDVLMNPVVERGMNVVSTQMCPRLSLVHTGLRMSISAGWTHSGLGFAMYSSGEQCKPDAFETSVYPIRAWELKMPQTFRSFSQYGNELLSSLRVLEILFYDNDRSHDAEYRVPCDDSETDDRPLPSRMQSADLLRALPQLDTLVLVGDTTGRMFLSTLIQHSDDAKRDEPQDDRFTHVDNTEHDDDDDDSDEEDATEKEEDDDEHTARGYKDEDLFTAKAKQIVPELCLALKTLHLHRMRLAIGRAQLIEEPKDIINSLELFLYSRQMHGLTIRELRATEAELQGDTDKEQDEWQAHFRQWVPSIHMTSCSQAKELDSDD
jgi:hypothetical protein